MYLVVFLVKLKTKEMHLMQKYIFASNRACKNTFLQALPYILTKSKCTAAPSAKQNVQPSTLCPYRGYMESNKVKNKHCNLCFSTEDIFIS